MPTGTLAHVVYFGERRFAASAPGIWTVCRLKEPSLSNEQLRHPLRQFYSVCEVRSQRSVTLVLTGLYKYSYFLTYLLTYLLLMSVFVAAMCS